MRLLRILIVGLVLWLLCGAVPERAAVSLPVPAAELSAADGLGDQFRCEQLCNSDFNLPRGISEAVSQPSFRRVTRTEEADIDPMLKYAPADGFNRGTVYAARSCGFEGTFVCGSVVDYYVYRLRRLII